MLGMLLCAVLAFTAPPASAQPQSGGVAPGVPAYEPGSATARLVVSNGEVTASANATGWSRSGRVCVSYSVYWGWPGANGSWDFRFGFSSGSYCGTGSASTPTSLGICPNPAIKYGRIVATATGPGGTDQDTRTIAVN